MNNYKVTGLVIKRHNLGEADRILTVFSKELGKLRVVAKGVRRGKSKLAGHLEPFIETEVQLVKGRNLDVVTGARGQKYYRLDGVSLEVVTTAYLLLEVIDRLLAEEQVNEAVYELLRESLNGLEVGLEHDLVRHYFFVKFLVLTGHQPDLQTGDGEGLYYLHFDSGSVRSKLSASQMGRPIERSIIKLWRLIYKCNLEFLGRVNGASEHLAAAQELIELFYEYHLHVRFKSEQILR